MVAVAFAMVVVAKIIIVMAHMKMHTRQSWLVIASRLSTSLL